MKRSKLNAIINILSLVLFLISLISGLVLWQILPGGEGSVFRGGFGSRGRTFINITRDEWLDLHNYSSILFTFSVTIQCLLHWSWFKSIRKILGGES